MLWSVNWNGYISSIKLKHMDMIDVLGWDGIVLILVGMYGMMCTLTSVVVYGTSGERMEVSDGWRFVLAMGNIVSVMGVLMCVVLLVVDRVGIV